jgi:hypothetical protein
MMSNHIHFSVLTPSSYHDKRKTEKAHIVKKLNKISLKMQRLHSTALGLQQDLKEQDETGSTCQVPHTRTVKRSREDLSIESNKRQCTLKEEEAGNNFNIVLYLHGCLRLWKTV